MSAFEEKLLKDIKKLKDDYKYSQAREVLLSKCNNDYENIKDEDLLRALAECHYKDLELHRDFSYDIALDILKQINNDKNEKETLCLKGAIYKRKWEYARNLDDLHKSIKYYEQAYTDFKEKDEGYGAINASYLYDILATKVDTKYSDILKTKANEIRKDIIKSFKDKLENKWLCHTVAQAYLGLEDTINCKDTLEKASKKYDYEDWEIFTTYKQLKLLANLKGIDDLGFLLPLIGEDSKYILEHPLDKKGLALSGGGFRASFFHLGTLAKLAEYNMLKDIEVISTVSGGSIIGVHYYLKLQKLLEENEDKTIEHNHYIKLVSDLIDEFYEIIQTDIRNSVLWYQPQKILQFLNPFSSYSRTNKLGELYQKRIFNKYKKYLRELKITPKDFDGEFKPRFDNWRRKNKVPILVINATNLNSGHNWQFHASKMGEPEYVSDLEIDKNNRFDWVRYDDVGLNKKFKDYSIGQAVACSSAVPMLFTPIVLKDLYEEYSLSLSDGGVYDNQGFSGLLSEECDYIICSDASGQMDNQITSHTSILRTNMRTIDIQMDRNRELLFEDIKKQNDKGSLKGFLFTHLKQGLNSHTVKQKDVIQKFDKEDKSFQSKISKIRTDLDFFSKKEAYSLIYNGYDLLQKQIDPKATDKNKHWVFKSIEEEIKNNSKELMEELALAQYLFTRRIRKWWRK